MINRLKFGIVLAGMVLLAGNAKAQEEEKGFNPNRVFVGGGIILGAGFGSNTSSFTIGLTPQVGYSFTNWLDAGVVFNGTYYNEKVDFGFGEDKYNSFTYGTGAFVRGYPFRSFFIQAQPEINWISYKRTYQGDVLAKSTVNAPSLLLGVGFGNRQVGRSGFFTTIMFDVLNERYSPYRTNTGGVLPIIQAGFIVYLAQKKQDRFLNYNNNRNGL